MKPIQRREEETFIAILFFFAFLPTLVKGLVACPLLSPLPPLCLLSVLSLWTSLRRRRRRKAFSFAGACARDGCNVFFPPLWRRGQFFFLLHYFCPLVRCTPPLPPAEREECIFVPGVYLWVTHANAITGAQGEGGKEEGRVRCWARSGGWVPSHCIVGIAQSSLLL